jgi:hypothetical protein
MLDILQLVSAFSVSASARISKGQGYIMASQGKGQVAVLTKKGNCVVQGKT